MTMAINRAQIQATLAQIQAAMARTEQSTHPAAASDTNALRQAMGQIKQLAHPAPLFPGDGANARNVTPAAKLDFTDALRNSIENINKLQNKADDLGKKFAMEDENVSLGDVMIAMQKAHITLQHAVQVRNKLVTAYHDIMNMSI